MSLKIITDKDEIRRIKAVQAYKELEEIYANKDWKKLSKLERERKKNAKRRESSNLPVPEGKEDGSH